MKSMLRAACLVAVSSLGLTAQVGSVSVVRSGSYEVGGFLGASYGIDKFRWMGGGNVTYAATKRVLPYAEFSYFPGIARTITVPSRTAQATATYNVPLSDFHGGVHLRFPIKESKIVPYGVFGMGIIHAPARTVTVKVDGIDLPVPQPSTSDFAVNFGGGLRYYIDQKFGVRAEAKMYKPTGTFSQAFGKVEFGFFVQLK